MLVNSAVEPVTVEPDIVVNLAVVPVKFVERTFVPDMVVNCDVVPVTVKPVNVVTVKVSKEEPVI